MDTQNVRYAQEVGSLDYERNDIARYFSRLHDGRQEELEASDFAS